MSGHVTYACPCLNIKIHLSSKYSLTNHDSERQQYWFHQETPALEGWLLQLGMGAVVVAYSSLIETQTSSTSAWMTVGCLNCSTDQVYSIHNKASTRRSSLGASLAPNQADESVVIHKDTLFGHQLDDIRNDDQFSDIFDIKLTDVTSSSSSSLVNQNEVPEKLHAQHQELYQVLDKALEKMRLASEVRIEQWKRVELERLEEESKKARDESNTLWKKVLSVNQQAKHNDNGDKTTPLATPTTESTPLTSTENPLASNEQVANNDLTLETRRSSHGIQFMDNTNDPGRSTVLGSRRRSSFSLDQNIIANRTNEPTPDVNQLGAVKENDSSSDDEDMFHLDEELPSDDDGDQQEQTDEQDTDTMAKASTSVESLNQSVDINQKGDSSKYGSSWIKKKRLGGKYINDFETSTDREEKEHGDGTEDLSKSISAFATSMPINIHSSSIGDFLASQDKNDDDTTSQQPTNNVSSRVIQPLFPSKQNTASYSFAPTKTTSSASFVGYDFSFSDRLLSKQFPDYNPERRKSVSTVSGRRHPQLDALIEKSSLDTRSMKK